MRVALVGLGRMGLPMCARLVGAGFGVVAFDRRPEAEADAARASARWAGTLSAAAADASREWTYAF